LFILILAFYAIYNTRFSWTFFDVQHFWISPLLILLGLIKPLGYSIGEVVELSRGLTQFQQSSKNKTKKEAEKSS
jgi:hypothetical protein